MNSSAPTPQQSFADSIAWLHQPVRLRRGVVPWFLVAWLEAEINSFLSGIARSLLALWELWQQAKLAPPAPKPERLLSACAAEASLKPQAVPLSRGAGCSAAPLPPEMSSAAALAEDEFATAPNAGEAAMSAPAPACIAVAQLLALPRRIVPSSRLNRPQRSSWSGGPMPQHRCDKTKFSSPALALWEICV